MKTIIQKIDNYFWISEDYGTSQKEIAMTKSKYTKTLLISSILYITILLIRDLWDFSFLEISWANIYTIFMILYVFIITITWFNLLRHTKFQKTRLMSMITIPILYYIVMKLDPTLWLVGYINIPVHQKEIISDILYYSNNAIPILRIIWIIIPIFIKKNINIINSNKYYNKLLSPFKTIWIFIILSYFFDTVARHTRIVDISFDTQTILNTMFLLNISFYKAKSEEKYKRFIYFIISIFFLYIFCMYNEQLLMINNVLNTTLLSIERILLMNWSIFHKQNWILWTILYLISIIYLTSYIVHKIFIDIKNR